MENLNVTYYCPAHTGCSALPPPAPDPTPSAAAENLEVNAESKPTKEGRRGIQQQIGRQSLRQGWVECAESKRLSKMFPKNCPLQF